MKDLDSKSFHGFAISEALAMILIILKSFLFLVNCKINNRTFFCEYLSRFWSKAEGRKGQFKSLAAQEESS